MLYAQKYVMCNTDFVSLSTCSIHILDGEEMFDTTFCECSFIYQVQVTIWLNVAVTIATSQLTRRIVLTATLLRFFCELNEQNHAPRCQVTNLVGPLG